MNRIQNLSIRVKLNLVIITTSLIAIIVGFSIITYLNINNLKANLIKQSTLIAKLTVKYSEFALVFEDKKVAKENLDNLKAISSIISAEIYDDNGKFLASFQDKPASFNLLKVNKASSEFKNNELHVYEPFTNSEGKFAGCLFMVVSQKDLIENVNNYIFWLVIIIIFILLMIIILAGNFQKIISRPILKLANLTQQISESHDYTIRIDTNSNDEIGLLYEGFNNMLEEIVRNQQTILRAHEELIDSQELFSTFMEMLPAAAYIKNADSTYSYINKFLNENFDAQQWIIGVSENKLHTEKRSLSAAFDKEALSSIQHFEEYIYNLDDELRYFENWKFPIYRKEKPTMIGSIAIDITERKLAEKQVNFYVTELERNNKDLEEFNYVASHDLREPLRTITSYCELLSEDIGDTINEIAKEDIKFITDATSRMNTLIQDLLQLSRAGRVEFEPRLIDLNDILMKVLQDLNLKIKETNSTINVHELPMVIGDATQLGSVFQNLLTNAIKFKSDKDPIINIEAIEISNNLIEISISDNGIGIDKQYHQQIFSAFKRLHSRGRYEGTGIGLAICKKIIERHNGSIHLESEIGKGSKFTIVLKKQINIDQ
jgi:signal transduction histidine kinase